MRNLNFDSPSFKPKGNFEGGQFFLIELGYPDPS